VSPQATVDDAFLRLCRPPLGLGRVDGTELALVVGEHGGVVVSVGDVEFGRDLGEDEARVLQVADRLPEGPALEAVPLGLSLSDCACLAFHNNHK
jgi:hypothetical protein